MAFIALAWTEVGGHHSIYDSRTKADEGMRYVCSIQYIFDKISN